MTPVTDPELLAQLNGKPVTDPLLLAQLDSKSSSGMDFLKSIPHGIMSGISGALSASGQSAAHEMSQPELAAEIPNAPATQKILEKNVTGETHVPEGRAGKFGAAIGESLGNPISYLGPGGIPLKVGGAILSSVGSEAAGQAAEGTKFETPARLAGGLVGGAAGVKAFAPKQLTAAIPTGPELRAAKDAGYQAARDADLVLHPEAVASWAAQAEHELTNGPKYAFTGGSDGTAPKTLKALVGVQDIPASGPGVRPIATGADLDKLRIQLNNIAGETHEFKPTPDAKAAMVAKRRLAEYTENIPADHVLAGDAKAYGLETKTANANNAAFHRVSDLEQKITNATDATEGSIAAKIDNQIKSKLRSGYLTNEKKQRGLTGEEVTAIRDTNRGTVAERFLRQVGRLAPEGPMNLALHVGTGLGAAAATGGASVIPQIAAALVASAAKHGAQRMTQSNAQKIAEIMAMRSPEYRRRAASIPAHDNSPARAAIVRALLTSR